MSFIVLLEKEVRRLETQIQQSMASHNGLLGAHAFAKQLLAKAKKEAESIKPNPDQNTVKENTPDNSQNPQISSVPPL